jgi:hypothetical protein
MDVRTVAFLATTLVLVASGPIQTQAVESEKAAPAASQVIPVPAVPVALGTVTKTSGCQAGYLPDPACTPGATDPSVTQANIGSTICRSGYSSAVRPPEATTNRIKHELLVAYGLPNTTDEMRQIELDHLVSLELGGAPSSMANLWPEVWKDSTAGPGAHTKDVLEARLHQLVCSGQMPLAEAQQKIVTDWYAEYQALGLHGRSGVVVD